MFRLVKGPDNEAAFFLLCDNRSCMEARRGNAMVANAEEYRHSRRVFLETAISEGWWVDLEGTYCPPHAHNLLATVQDAQAKTESVVEPARPEQVVAFGKGRPS